MNGSNKSCFKEVRSRGPTTDAVDRRKETKGGHRSCYDIPRPERLRKNYGKSAKCFLEMPNLIEVQKSSMTCFPDSATVAAPAEGEGIWACSSRVFPDQGFQRDQACWNSVNTSWKSQIRRWKSALQRDMTYAAQLKVTLRLIVFDVDEVAGPRKSVKDIKEQGRVHWRYALMTPNGTFV